MSHNNCYFNVTLCNKNIQHQFQTQQIIIENFNTTLVYDIDNIGLDIVSSNSDSLNLRNINYDNLLVQLNNVQPLYDDNNNINGIIAKLKISLNISNIFGKGNISSITETQDVGGRFYIVVDQKLTEINNEDETKNTVVTLGTYTSDHYFLNSRTTSSTCR